MAHLLCSDVLEAAGELCGKNFLKLAAFPFSECLAYTENDIHALSDCKADLAVDVCIGFTIVASSLAVAEDNGIDTEVLEHCGSNLTSVCT